MLMSTGKAVQLLLLAWFCLQHCVPAVASRAVQRSSVLAPSRVISQHTAAPSQPTRVAIYNDLEGHLEIIAGILQALCIPSLDVTLILHPGCLRWGFAELTSHLNYTMRPLAAHDQPLPADWTPGERYDVVLLVSGEYRRNFNRNFVEVTQPKAVIAWIHNGDSGAETEFMAMHPNMHVVTLSPHVSKFLEAKWKGPDSTQNQGLTTNPVQQSGAPGQPATLPRVQFEWVLPVFLFEPPHPCTAEACLDGVTVQGAMERTRRNYTTVWEQLSQARGGPNGRTSKAQLPAHTRRLASVWVFGYGDPASLGVPPDLQDSVHVHVGLGFPDFFQKIHNTSALLRCFAHSKYFSSKFSSTVVTSLVTGVPIVATRQLLEAYTFLDPSVVLLQQEGQGELEAVLQQHTRLMQVRAALSQRRQELSRLAREKLLSLMGARRMT